MDRSILATKLDVERKALLDLTARNRLLNTPRHRARSKSVEVVDERSAEVYRILVDERRKMAFLPKPEAAPDDEAPVELPPPVEASGASEPSEAEPDADDTPAPRHVDRNLQTALADAALDKRLLGMFYDARTMEEEQGVNILYLALGFVQWFEDESSDVARHAPLLLVPCELVRSTVGGRISLVARDDDLTTNLSLKARLAADFGVTLPDLPDDELDPTAYFAAVRDAITGRARWTVTDDDIVLGFFSFAKFLMYEDLDLVRRGGADVGEETLSTLLGHGFEAEPPLWTEATRIDAELPAADLRHVMDADSSQTEAIEEVKAARHLVIQGPPGTGKSQTIVNLIAAAVADGRRVLFVAEKLAALEVVHRRLEEIGLGGVCLELHSRKASKRQVLDALDRTLSLGSPALDDLDRHVARLADVRDTLNVHAATLHTPLDPAGRTPYEILGAIVRLQDEETPTPSGDLAGALEWTRADYDERLAALHVVRDLAERLGTPAEHPWRGSRVDAPLPSDLERLAASTATLADQCAALDAIAPDTARALAVAPPAHATDAQRFDTIATALRAAPAVDLAAFAHPGWRENRAAIRALVERGGVFASRREAATRVFGDDDGAWDPTPTRETLAKHASSWFRILSGAYRGAHAEFVRRATNPPKSTEDRILALDRLSESRRIGAEVDEAGELGAGCFGSMWQGRDSDWALLARIVEWFESADETIGSDDLANALSALDDLGPIAERCADIRRIAGDIVRSVASVGEQTHLDFTVAFDCDAPGTVPFSSLPERVDAWRTRPERLAEWAPIGNALARLDALGVGVVRDELYTGAHPPAVAVARFEFAYFETWLREALARHPDLARFTGHAHDTLIDEFCRLDRKRIELARAEVALAHVRGIPRGGGGEIGLIRTEIKKKRRHLPIRKLIERAGRTVQAVKPVFMMSPLSVAQFLPPGAIEFDLLLIDEASQVEPVDAFGAILRAKQIVVVGDEKQLPPTSFFGRTLEGDDDEQDVADIESILGLCSAKGLGEKMLSWHYRSQHQSLIAVSNREFYDDRLHVVPSPFAESDALGLKFHFVDDGVFDRGGSGANRAEAARVARAAIDHARAHPGDSLGIGAFSIRQRDAILDELEALWRAERDVRGFFESGGPEPFFVKNLENIQGDERDVIFISVGYGPDADGRFTMNFGPLSREGGERRLNVLITRAKKRCEVFSSIRHGAIDLSKTSGRGPAALRTFLNYAEVGMFAAGEASGGFDSPFEASVARALTQHGHAVESQIGLAGFYVDLGVKDPDEPGRYRLGIECDGASYHSARSARERDRLRQQILESRGWTIHRIWSTDWFKDRDAQLRRALAAIDAAATAPPPSPPEPPAPVALDAAADTDDDARYVPYDIADFAVDAPRAIHETAVDALADVAARVVAIEGPVHGDEVARRVATLWGQKRTGGRIRECVEAALAHALAAGHVRESSPGFFDRPEPRPPRVRERSGAASSLRKPEALPPSEVRAAIELVVGDNTGIERSELARLVARAFGFGSTSAQMAALVDQAVAPLVDDVLVERDGKLFPAAR